MADSKTDDTAEDTELVARCRDGDRQALDLLVRKYQRVLFSVALRMQRNPDDAADTVQNAFIKAFEKLHLYDANQKFFSWIYRITINEALNASRRQGYTADAPAAEPMDPGPEEALGQASEAARLHQALQQLKEDARSVIVLRHFSDLNYAEIAEILQIHEETVKSRLFSARRKLAELLQSRD